MENEKRLSFLASEVAIAEDEKLNPVFLSIKMKLADNVGNRNNEGITAAFISDLIKRQEEFDCLPFYADVKNLLARNYDKLGHMYNRMTRKFASTQIGSLTDFYSETDNDGVISLYATARVPKREQEICIRLAELFDLGKLCVSFEVRYNPEDTIEKDGVLFIDAGEDNALTGMALVSVPACEDAVALDMVAEVADGSDAIVAESEEQNSERGETETMPKEMEMTAEENVVAETEEIAVSEEVVEAEAVQDENPITVAEDNGEEGEDEEKVEPTEEREEDDENATAEAEEANAEVVAHTVETYETVETLDPAAAIAEKDQKIAELETKIAELEQYKAKYDEIVAEAEAKELANKQAKAKAFAEKQGLNVEDTAVAEAIEKLDYSKIAELSMAEEQEEVVEEPAKQTITLASFVEMEVSDDKYGGLLSRKNK